MSLLPFLIVIVLYVGCASVGVVGCVSVWGVDDTVGLVGGVVGSAATGVVGGVVGSATAGVVGSATIGVEGGVVGFAGARGDTGTPALLAASLNTKAISFEFELLPHVEHSAL